MSKLISTLVACAVVGAAPRANRPAALPLPDFKARFGQFEGCFVLQDLHGDTTIRYNDPRCLKRFAPCSTFKIFNAMAGLDCGAVADENTVIKWDGSKQFSKTWEHDHTLATAIRDSVLWYFREVAKRVGPQRMQLYLDRCNYGNRSMAGGIDKFWIDDTLQISADEQVTFLTKLYANQLPFSARSQALVKKLIVLDRGSDWQFSGKTGSMMAGEKRTLGWFVGHVTSRGREYVFAANISSPDGATGRVCKDIVFNLLKDMKLVGGK